MKIKKYEPNDEKGWVRCRTLSFLETAYFDNVLREKENYENPAIELVAVIDDQIVGLIDVEYERKEKTVCTRDKGLGGMIWHIAVHPDFQREGIGGKLLGEAEKIAKEKGINYLEAWTRDDKWVHDWYVKSGFTNVYTYLQVYMEGKRELGQLKSESPDLHPVQAWAHYNGDDQERIKAAFTRVHDCSCFVKVVF